MPNGAWILQSQLLASHIYLLHLLLDQRPHVCASSVEHETLLVSNRLRGLYFFLA